MITPYNTPNFCVAVNEKVEEVSPDEGGFTKVKNSAGKKGLVPTEHLGNIVPLLLCID